MNVHVLEIPESTSELADWLEGHLVGLHLGTLVAELMAVHGDPDYRPLEEILGPDLPRVLEEGLQGVSREKLSALLRHPAVLLELQERVVIEGGPHWESRAQSNNEVQQEVSAGWKRLQTAISAPQTQGTASGPRPNPGSSGAITRRMVLLATAAMVLVAMGVWLFQNQPSAPTVATWGWDKPGALPDDVDAPQYLAALAEGADQWFNKSPDTKAELHKRLDEFRRGCETLINAPHRPLAQADREWLVEKCKAWKAKIEGHIADLDQTGDIARVRTEANGTVSKLIIALRERENETRA